MPAAKQGFRVGFVVAAGVLGIACSVSGSDDWEQRGLEESRSRVAVQDDGERGDGGDSDPSENARERAKR